MIWGTKRANPNFFLELAHTPSPSGSVTVHVISAGYPAGLVFYEDEDYPDSKEAGKFGWVARDRAGLLTVTSLLAHLSRQSPGLQILLLRAKASATDPQVVSDEPPR